MTQIKSLLTETFNSIPLPGVMDLLDILAVAYLFYVILKMMRSSNAFRIAKAIMLFLIVTGLTWLLHMYALNFLLKRVLEVGMIALLIMFQPELRQGLNRLGSASLRELIAGKTNETQMSRAIFQTASACEEMSHEKIGALIVFEQSTPLNDYFKTGTVLDAELSDLLLRSLFFPNSALHDGAVIIRNGRIAAAGCVLPLTEKEYLSRDLGTRHRAALGVSECSDAVVVVVSEETGTISVAEGGMLKRHLTGSTLSRLLTSELVHDENVQKRDLLPVWLRSFLTRYWKKKDDSHAEK